MESLPSDLYNYNILLNLSVDEIYRFCLAGKANYAYCDSVKFWRSYFDKKSHSRVQKIIKYAAKKKLFGFIKFVCEHASDIKIFLDLRTLNYCYYYFAEQNNKDAVNYLYNYMINNYIDKNIDESLLHPTFSEYRIDKDIIKIYDNLVLLTAIVKSLTSNNMDVAIRLLSELWKLLNNSYYPDYIIDYIMKDYSFDDMIILLRICINIINNMTTSTSYYEIFTELIAYIIRKNGDEMINLVENEFNTPELKIYFIENTNYNRYVDIFGKSPQRVQNIDAEMFRDKTILDLYMKRDELAYLRFAYMLISPEEVLNYITQSKKSHKSKIAVIKDLVYYSRMEGYTYWANVMSHILKSYISIQ